MRDVWFENRHVRLFAAEDGDGPAIVMLHGGMATHEAALPVVAGLASRYRVIAGRDMMPRATLLLATFAALAGLSTVFAQPVPAQPSRRTEVPRLPGRCTSDAGPGRR